MFERRFLKGDSIVCIYLSLLFFLSSSSPALLQPALQTKHLTVGNELFLNNLAITDGQELNPLLLAINASLYLTAGGKRWCSLLGPDEVVILFRKESREWSMKSKITQTNFG